MTLNDKIIFYLMENPKATNSDIANFCEIQENHAKVTISKLKSRGILRFRDKEINVLSPY